MKKQKCEQSEIELGVEQWPFLEKQSHTVRFVRPLIHRGRFALPATHKEHHEPSFLEGQARLVDTLVGY